MIKAVLSLIGFLGCISLYAQPDRWQQRIAYNIDVNMNVATNQFTGTEKIDYWFSHRDELQQAKEAYIEFSKQYLIENSYRKLEATYYSLLAQNGDSISKPVPKFENV